MEFNYIRKKMNMKKRILFSLCLLSVLPVIAQEDTLTESAGEEAILVEEPEDPYIRKTYNATRIINGHSNETLEKGVLEFRIEHRFGDMAGDNGGVQNWFGFDMASDIRFAFEYGITDRLMVGLGRNKGTGMPYRSLVDSFVKYRLLRQKKTGMPVSVTLLGVATGSYQKASADVSQVAHFPNWQHRLAYASQANIARKFGRKVSLSLMPTFVYRNYVTTDDQNALFALGGAAKFNISPRHAIIVEYYQTFAQSGKRPTDASSFGPGFRNSFGIAYEWDTFGHNFTINLTNSRGFTETQFIPYTFEDWAKGQFRFGFSISRKFSKE
jgi:hypothetical protein